MSSSYQVVYGVHLLDDLHNYFPALLYDMGRFRTLPQVFQDVRHQMDRRFNLFSYGAGLFAQTQEQSMPVPSMAQTDLDGLFRQVIIQSYMAQPTNQSIAEQISQAFGTTGAAAGFMSPVIVRPSAQVIQENTEVIQGSSLAETTLCSICQDTISTTDTARLLSRCRHLYHLNCIDRWFERSVVCPTCRHDIRISQTTTESAPLDPTGSS